MLLAEAGTFGDHLSLESCKTFGKTVVIRDMWGAGVLTCNFPGMHVRGSVANLRSTLGYAYRTGSGTHALILITKGN